MNTDRTVSTISRRCKALGLGVALGLILATPAQASVDIADIPLFLSASVDPNIMFVIDDSGSMMFETLPDENGLNIFVDNSHTDWWNRMVTFVYPQHQTTGTPAGVTFSDCIYTNGTSSGCDYWRSSVYLAERLHQVPRFETNNRWAAYFRSSENNLTYYNPQVRYLPWVDENNNSWGNVDPAAAPHNPANPGKGTRNLTIDNTQRACWVRGTASASLSNANLCDTGDLTFYPATYFQYNGSDVLDPTSYTRVEIKNANAPFAGGSQRTDCANPNACTYQEEIQNFANWYSYYRARILATRAGIGQAFARQGEGMRVGFSAINKSSETIDGASTTTIIRGVRPFTGTDRTNFFGNLYNDTIPLAGTPLRQALDDAGQYYSRTSNLGPWGAVPGTNDTTSHLECRQSFTILMTDGYWNGSQAGTSSARSNNDGTDGPTISGPGGLSHSYQAVSPFTDNRSNTLADVAMHYWKNDLRTDLDNLVPHSVLNPAFWQHMVTFGVGLGVAGTIDPATAFSAIDDPNTTISWPDPTPEGSQAKIDDLLHAAVNSRGGFFSASDPVTFANELSDILSTIVARVDSSATSAAASSATLQTDSLLYTAGFRAKDWTGQLIARELLSDGKVKSGAPKWDAEVKLVTQVGDGSRKLFTSVRSAVDAGTQVVQGAGVKLDDAVLGSLSANQQSALGSDTNGMVDGLAANRIKWLYGDESAHASFRSRQGVDSLGNAVTRLLGDVIGSNPQFAGKRDFGYRRLTGLTPSYLDFRATNAYENRPDILYVGANDGMLHAFDATTGLEHFAYMPSELLLPEAGDNHARINHLMDQDYSHRYYVDGTVTIWDAHWGSSWKSVLVGAMGAGGRTVYALDVTFPQSFDQTKVLWEFTDPDLGYGVDKPTIVRMKNGDWAAVFGNGYNGNSHKAVLYIVRLRDGQLLAKINTNQAADSAASPNGLSTPTVTLSLDTLSANIIYAGDLKGRLWRFDVSSSNANDWDTAGNRTVLFQAVDSSNNPQPITSAPEVAVKPGDPSTLVVLFGTGSYFRNPDSGSTQVQSLYGIFDKNGSTVTRADLLAQEIIWEGVLTFGGQDYTLREVSDETFTNTNASKQGWVMDLIVNSAFTGERVISKPVLLSGSIRDRVRFTTMIPNPDPCGTGGGRDGFVMDLLLGSGGAAAFPVFDLNNDGSFNTGDMLNGRNFSGLNFGGGEQLIVIQTGDGQAKLYTGAGEDISALEPGTPMGRQSWRQLR